MHETDGGKSIHGDRRLSIEGTLLEDSDLGLLCDSLYSIYVNCCGQLNCCVELSTRYEGNSCVLSLALDKTYSYRQSVGRSTT